MAPSADAQSYNCSTDYWSGGYNCYGGGSYASCGSANYWGAVSCNDRYGRFNWNTNAWGAQTWGSSSLFQPTVPTSRSTPSFLDSWMTGASSSRSSYCSLLAALGC